MRPTFQYPPLTRQMWDHSFSHFSTEDVRQGLMARQTCRAATDILDSSHAASELRALSVNGLQKQGIAYGASVTNTPIDPYQTGLSTVMYPVQDALDFRSGEQLKGTYVIGSDINDFVASEYGQFLGVDPFRDPRQVMTDTLREQQYPAFAFDRRDLANRFFLQNATQSALAQQEKDMAQMHRIEQQQQVKESEEILDQMNVRQDTPNYSRVFDPYLRSTKIQIQQQQKEETKLAIAQESSRQGSMNTLRSRRGGSMSTPHRGKAVKAIHTPKTAPLPSIQRERTPTFHAPDELGPIKLRPAVRLEKDRRSKFTPRTPPLTAPANLGPISARSQAAFARGSSPPPTYLGPSFDGEAPRRSARILGKLKTPKITPEAKTGAKGKSVAEAKGKGTRWKR